MLSTDAFIADQKEGEMIPVHERKPFPDSFVDFEEMKIYSRDQAQKIYYESSFYSFEYICDYTWEDLSNDDVFFSLEKEIGKRRFVI